jgi:hypothetical protein
LSIKNVNSEGDGISAWKAIAIGHLWISVPGIILFFSVFFTLGSLMRATGNRLVPALGGLIVGWVWYAVMAPRWRRWALGKGAPLEKLRSLAILTGLTWGRDGDRPQKKR